MQLVCVNFESNRDMTELVSIYSMAFEAKKMRLQTHNLK
jgi:hypothetical protein